MLASSRLLSFGRIAGCAAAVAASLNVLCACWTGLGIGALRGSLGRCGRDTGGAAWELVDARVRGGSRTVASAGPRTTGHELRADITAVDVGYSASGRVVREADTARAGRRSRVITVVKHPASAR